MATSESDDFESADEELAHEQPKNPVRRKWSPPTAIDSESDEDTEYVPRNYEKLERHSTVSPGERPLLQDKLDKDDNNTRATHTSTQIKQSCDPTDNVFSSAKREDTFETRKVESAIEKPSVSSDFEKTNKEEVNLQSKRMAKKSDEKLDTVMHPEELKFVKDKPRSRPERKSDEMKHRLGAKKLGTRIFRNNDKPEAKESLQKTDLSEELEKFSIDQGHKEKEEAASEEFKNTETELSLMSELAEPEELKSNKKFKELFEPQGWERLGNDIELPQELTEEKLQPVLDRLSSAREKMESSSGGWGNWGSWGVSTLLNTATAGVSTLTSHVSHGLTLLEESIGTPDSTEPDVTKELEASSAVDEESSISQETQSLAPFGLGNLISGVSSITKLVESTGSKVMSGGLDTLEAIGKKTMEVLQEGDPGLKKKRAFFTNESDKPNLSQVLREAKEKAEAAEKTLEEKQCARKIHFESLFDDYQGLVHLEALEMLSKQSNMKIQQHLAGLSGVELTSIQETLEDVKELCDPTDEDEEESQGSSYAKQLKLRLEDACSDLGIDIAYQKLCTIWDESQVYLAPPVKHSDLEVFQRAVSALAQFTAFSIERFHKTAELLLIKQRRSTVNEADALVQLTRILSNQIGLLAHCFCNTLNGLAKTSVNPEIINGNITTVFLEATNASSYVEEAFRLLVPIIQVGAI